MNRVVNSILRYFHESEASAFPARTRKIRPRRPKFLISSTEV
jgi:hypothetical protein